MVAKLSLKNAWLPKFFFWIPITLDKVYLLYGGVLQGLGTTEFTDLIG